jgi:arabinosaccharide transport system substrate-binding protein
MRSFPFGAAALCILTLSVLSGAWLALHPVQQKTSTLTLWISAPEHQKSYLDAVPSFEAAHPGVTVDVQLVGPQAVTTRLQAAFGSDLDVPDLVEVPIDFAGSFFRGPIEHVGFADLTDRIHQAGLWDKMVRSRFAPYTSRGRIFGLPHDVHPIQLAYRRDIFEKEGIDARRIKTWDDFIRIGRKLTIPNQRYMIELFDYRDAHLAACLFQRGGGYFNPQGDCIFDNEIAVQTMRWYVPLVAGKDKIAGSLGAGQILTKAVEDGYFLCLIMPDWRTKTLEKDIPRMAGKMALMPLPAVTPGGLRTSTWGGTMMGITRHCKNQDLAWQFALHLYLDKKELGARFQGTNILPALREAWTQPAFHEPRPYWSNQRIGALYAELAPHVPSQYTGPFIVPAKAKLGEAVVACVQYYNTNGEKGFEDYVRFRLRQSANEVRALMRKNPF